MNDSELPRLHFQCRRGMKELDVLLQGYLKRSYVSAGASEQLEFRLLLEREDPEIWSWIVGFDAAPPPLARIVERVRGNE